MIASLLLPHRYKTIGWLIFIPSFIIGIVLLFVDFDMFAYTTKTVAILSNESLGEPEKFAIIQTNITPTIVGALFIIGALLVCFSKEKMEDEYISKLRLSSLMWSLLINYTLLLLSMFFVYGTAYFTIMLFHLFAILVIFIGRFNFILYKNSKADRDAE